MLMYAFITNDSSADLWIQRLRLNIVFYITSVAASENNMSEKEIGEVFGPILLRPSQDNLT